MARQRKTEDAATQTVYTVTRRFQDAPEYRDETGTAKVYELGADVSHFDQERLDKLIERGNVVAQTVDSETESTEAD